MFRPVGAGEVKNFLPVSSEVLEDLILIFPIEKISRSDCFAGPSLNIAFINHYDPIRIRVRRRAKQHGVDHTENHTVGADSKREDENRYDTKRTISHHHSDSVAKILYKCLHDSS